MNPPGGGAELLDGIRSAGDRTTPPGKLRGSFDKFPGAAPRDKCLWNGSDWPGDGTTPAAREGGSPTACGADNAETLETTSESSEECLCTEKFLMRRRYII